LLYTIILAGYLKHAYLKPTIASYLKYVHMFEPNEARQLSWCSNLATGWMTEKPKPRSDSWQK
jgi:hypothetical protein